MPDVSYVTALACRHESEGLLRPRRTGFASGAMRHAGQSRSISTDGHTTRMYRQCVHAIGIYIFRNKM